VGVYANTLFDPQRHKVLVEGRSRREVAEQMGVRRNTVRKYVEQCLAGR
jgi:DNA-binding NarL/FixJ family response regulator